MKNEKVSIKDAPYYYVEGKGWKINQSYTHPEYGRICINKQWFRTKGEAKANYEAVLFSAIERAKARFEASNFPNKVSTWEQFFQAYRVERLNEVRGSTWHSKDRPMVAKYFEPHFAGKNVCDCFSEKLAREIKKEIVNSKTRFGYSVPKSDKNRAIALYNKMLDFAYENDYCTDITQYRHCKAAMKKIRVCDDEDGNLTRQPRSLTIPEIERVLSVIEFGSADYVITKLLFMAGLRIGELLALTPADLDLEKDIVNMSHIIAPDKDGTLKRFTRAKTTNGIRKVPLTSDMAKLLRFYIDSEKIRNNGFLFPGFEEGRPLDRSAYARRLKKYCLMAEVTPVNPHAARHTFCTIAHELGYPVEVIAMILGHTITVDMNVYNHLANIEKGRKMVEEMFTGPAKA